MFRLLVKKFNVTVFVLEDQYSTCQLINNYIHGDNNMNLNSLINKLMWPWRSIYLVQLIKWMKKYNLENNNQLEFKGVDIAFVVPEYSPSNDPVSLYIKKLTEMKPKYSFEEDYKNHNYRDAAMFEIFMKIYDRTKKYFIMMHNGHVEKESNYVGVKNFGLYMNYYFANNYFVIGNSFNGDSFLALNRIVEPYGLQVSDFGGEIDVSKLTYYEGVTLNYYDDINFQKTKPSDLKYKLQNGLTWNPVHNKLLKELGIPIINNNKSFHKMFTIEAGSNFDPSNIYRTPIMYRIRNRFDVVLQLSHDTALQFE